LRAIDRTRSEANVKVLRKRTFNDGGKAARTCPFP
jgi:hypothetical protein